MGDSDLAELLKQCLSSIYTCTENIFKYLDDTERHNEYKKLESIVQEYCLLEVQQDVAMQALEKAEREIYASKIDTLNDEFVSNLGSTAVDLLNSDRHPYMLEFNKRVQKENTTTRNNIDDSDIAIMESQTTYNDPFTKKAIEDPVRNTLCGHIYEREVIMNIVQRKSHKGIKCPVAGCGNRELIIPNHLISDDELKFKMTITHHSTMIQE